jgi:uncharacterized protein
MEVRALRLSPGADLRAALRDALHEAAHEAGYVLQGIGSLSVANIRMAGKSDATTLNGDFEILTLAGTLSPDGVHLHISVADAAGKVSGGHVSPGCIVRTTAEVLVGFLPGQRFSRVRDAATGYPELVITRTSHA